MAFPLSLFDFGLWLASTAIVLLITTEVLVQYMETLGNVVLERKRLRLVALGLSFAFVVIVIIRSFQQL